MGVVTPLNNPGGPEGDTVTVAEKLLNTEYWHSERLEQANFPGREVDCIIPNGLSPEG